MMPAQLPPLLRVAVGGRQLNEIAAGCLAQARVRLRLAMPAQCVLTFDLTGLPADGRFPTPSPGEDLRVDVEGHTEPLFAGEVTAFEYAYGSDRAQLLRVRAYDVLHRLRQRQEVRVHEGVTLAELVTILCAGTGLDVDAPNSPRWERIYQYGQSDLELLRDVAGRCAHFPLVDGGALRLVTLAGSGDPLELQLGDTMHSARVEVTAEPGFRSVRAYRWDAATANSSVQEVDSSTARAQVSLTIDPAATGVGGSRTLLDEAAAGEDVPAALAAATLDVITAGEVTVSLVAEGDTGLRPGRRLLLRGVGSDLAGTYAITDATHMIDRVGYTVTVSTRPPPVPAAPNGSVVTLGTVTDVADPDGRGRVRVRLDAYGGLESGWAAVVVAGAGDAKGALLLPDVDDHVAVVMARGNPEQALVLGGLFGTTTPPADPVAGDRVRRWAIQGANGQRLLLDADAKQVRLEGHNGSRVELGDRLAKISAATDLIIEAPGKTVTISAKAVDFSQAP